MGIILPQLDLSSGRLAPTQNLVRKPRLEDFIPQSAKMFIFWIIPLSATEVLCGTNRDWTHHRLRAAS